MKFNMNKISMLAAAITTAAIMVPGLASAYSVTGVNTERGEKEGSKIELENHARTGIVNGSSVVANREAGDREDGDRDNDNDGDHGKKNNTIKVKGTVTAVTGTALTVQDKNGATTAVTTDVNTQITNAGAPATLSDITVGTKVKVVGLWDQILNIFTALKIMIK